MPDAIPLFANPDHVTAIANAAGIVGKRFVKYVAGSSMSLLRVELAGAGDTPAGVAAHDVEQGEALHLITHDHIPVTAGEDLAVGDLVAVGADGKAVKAAAATEDGPAQRPVGIVAVAGASGADAGIFLY